MPSECFILDCYNATVYICCPLELRQLEQQFGDDEGEVPELGVHHPRLLLLLRRLLLLLRLLLLHRGRLLALCLLLLVLVVAWAEYGQNCEGIMSRGTPICKPDGGCPDPSLGGSLLKAPVW